MIVLFERYADEVQVTEMTFDYTDCDTLTSSSSDSPSFTNIPNFSYKLASSDSGKSFNPPQYAFVQDLSNPNKSLQNQCIVQFDVAADLDASVFLYYKLTNFYQNHRRYVQSLDTNQLKGQAVSVSTLNNGDCKPLATIDGKPVWPCGLIANSIFNGAWMLIIFFRRRLTGGHWRADTFSGLSAQSDGALDYNFSESGIAWPGEAKKYSPTPGYSDLSQIVPPPNWIERFPSYNSSNVPNLHIDEHFQNWMRTAALPTFSKLWGRNDNDQLKAGTYRLTVNMSEWCALWREREADALQTSR